MPAVPNRPISKGELLNQKRKPRVPMCTYYPNRGDFVKQPAAVVPGVVPAA